MNRLDNKVALVTGGARGLGASSGALHARRLRGHTGLALLGDGQPLAADSTFDHAPSTHRAAARTRFRWLPE